ncbi:MAG: Lrp/AsnC family transcriptional regulator [Gammaproteobacteria bacterium]|nr:Lrp/AsnC family transcriptional regulator [Gammaproteobacteria bacterium]
MDALDRAIINALQDGFPISERPFAEAAATLDISEGVLIDRIESLLDTGVLSRFGPMYHAERLGGGLSLAVMKLAKGDFDQVAEIVNAFPEVAHNYARDHEFNMWFVLATETTQRISEVIDQIEQETGYRVYNMPKLAEYFVGLRFEA